MVCRYYLQGACFYGKNCRYDHSKPKESEKAESKSAKREFKPPRPPVQHSFGEVAVYKSGVIAKCIGGPMISWYPSYCIQMTKLTKQGLSSSSNTIPENWAEAPEFVPSWIKESAPSEYTEGDEHSSLYSTAAKAGIEIINELSIEESGKLLCPFAAMGTCEFESCPYLHGLVCEFCGKQCLHPFNLEQQHDHIRDCQKALAMNVEHTFAMKRSQGVQCSICLDVVLDKLNLSDRRFGILSECKHPFCLSCIRKWRNLSHANNKIVRACPICRVPSWFVTPSDVWIEEDEEKQRLIEGYKASLR
jgi:E3 ubiquitin-protein ligase makorin